jgi:ribosome recycling factor
MAYNFSHFKTQLAGVETWLQGELASIHTGRATPALLDGVKIVAYGSLSPIMHVASIVGEDPRTLRVSPWDKSHTKEIEKAVNEANLGVSASADGEGVRVFFPELTAERRTMFAKIARERLEDARISVRKEREECWNDIQAKEKDGSISEDDKFRSKEELQKMVDETNKKLETMTERKEKEITS